MAIPYVTFMKHAQKVTKSASASRPVLKGVHHAANGDLVVTDSHRLYVAKNSHTSELGEITDPKTGQAIDGNYPEVSRLIPGTYNVKFTTKLAVDEAVKAFEALLKVNQINGKGREMVNVESKNGDYETIVFKAESTVMNASYEVSHVDGTVEPITFNTTFMLDALKLFKDAGATEVTFRSYGSFRPFTLTGGPNDELLALILPIRIPN